MPGGTEEDCEKLKNFNSLSLTEVQKRRLTECLSQFSPTELNFSVNIMFKINKIVHLCTCTLKYWFRS
jgi:hypothetical protein